jgi:phosphatidylcholine synthase
MTRPTLAALTIHFYTASGAILAFWALAALAERRFPAAFLLLLVAFFVDYTDGTLARRLNVMKVFPQIDGSTLDHVVDFLTNAVIPVFIMWQSDTLPKPRAVWMTAILLTTLFRFSKTFNPWLTRGFLSGIPSPWINLAFYLFFYRPHGALPIIAILVLIALTFIPIGYIHIARFPRWRFVNTLALAGWWVIYLFVTQGWTRAWRFWLPISLVFPAFYLASSWWFAVCYRSYSGLRSRQALDVGDAEE